MEQMDAFAKLFEDAEFYKRVMTEIAKATYLRFRNSELGEERQEPSVIHVQHKPVEYTLDEETNLLMAAENCSKINKKKQR